MAANIESMVSAAGIIPWHKQGKVLEGYPDINTMYCESGLDWQVAKRPVFFKEDPMLDQYAPVEDTYCLVRDKDDKPLGICSGRYVPFQNKEAFDWCSPLIDSKLWKMETAGALRGGKLCWALLNQGEREIVKGDTLKNYLLVHWSHDGTLAVQTGLTSIRVVCENTLKQALRMDGSKMAKFRHDSKLHVRMSELQQMYEYTDEEFKEQQKLFKILSETSVDKTAQEQYIEDTVNEIFKDADFNPEDPSSLKRHNNAVEQTRDNIEWFVKYGSGMKELNLHGSAWGMFNGVEEYLEKAYGGNRIKDRGYNVLMGRSSDLITGAYNRAMTLALAQ